MGEINKLAEGEGSGFYRTSKGQKAHRSVYCANSRRSIWSQVDEIPAAEIRTWTPCLHCCSPEEREIHWKAPAAAAPAKAKCRNEGVKNPQRIYSTCRNCGKEGKVNRSTGKIRAHEPLAK